MTIRLFRKILCLCGLFLLPLTPALAQQSAALPPLEVTFFDCGKADSALLRAGGYTMLIDTGTNKAGKSVVAQMKEMGITQIDVLVITHRHKDHVGGADLVLENFAVADVVESPLRVDSKQVEQYEALLTEQSLTPHIMDSGDRFTLGDMTIDVLAPKYEAYDDENNMSLVLRVGYGKTSFLFCGDAEKLSLAEMMADFPQLVNVDVLKVPHHGRAEDNSAAFFALASPQIAVIPCTRDTKDALPDAGVTAALSAFGAQVFITDAGNVTVLSDGETVTAVQ